MMQKAISNTKDYCKYIIQLHHVFLFILGCFRTESSSTTRLEIEFELQPFCKNLQRLPLHPKWRVFWLVLVD